MAMMRVYGRGFAVACALGCAACGMATGNTVVACHPAACSAPLVIATQTALVADVVVDDTYAYYLTGIGEVYRVQRP